MRSARIRQFCAVKTRAAELVPVARKLASYRKAVESEKQAVAN